MRQSLRALLSTALSLSLPSFPSFAFDLDLSDTSVREAYFLGQRRDEKMKAFFAPYSKLLPAPKKGPHISEIRFRTPLAQVVEVSSMHTTGYSAQQAALDYHARGDSLLLEVHIEFTPTYNLIEAERSSKNIAGEKGFVLRTEDFWQDFRIGLKQKEDWIEPLSIHGEPEYTSPSSGTGSNVLIGAWVGVVYDARKVDSDSAEVSVATPDGQDVSASFDLLRLR
jgi:hypothetical protein